MEFTLNRSQAKIGARTFLENAKNRLQVKIDEDIEKLRDIHDSLSPGEEVAWDFPKFLAHTRSWIHMSDRTRHLKINHYDKLMFNLNLLLHWVKIAESSKYSSLTLGDGDLETIKTLEDLFGITLESHVR